MNLLIGVFICLLLMSRCSECESETTNRLPVDSPSDDVDVRDCGAFAGGQLILFRKREQPDHGELTIHFHGAGDTVKQNFASSRLQGPLAVLNFRGLSTAYSRPFLEDPQLFRKLLTEIDQHLSQDRLDEVQTPVGSRRLRLSCFSAGYGAVRQILSRPEDRRRVHSIVAADSIYAGIDPQAATREVLASNMTDFLLFADEACREQKSFLITHSSQPTEYASTTETAGWLLQKLNVPRSDVSNRRHADLHQTSYAAKGHFRVLGFSGVDGADHMAHLRNIRLFWDELLDIEAFDDDRERD